MKYRFSWWPPWISDWKILAFFDLFVTLMLPTKFQVNWPFGSGEVKNNFQDSHHGNHHRPKLNDFSYFLSTSHPYASYQVSSQWAFLFRRGKKK